MDDDQELELEALETILSDPSAEPIKLSHGLLKSITDNFSCEIGRGGFGVVFKGYLLSGVVAVKRSTGLSVTDKQFMDEIKCLKSANHKNIVRFLGYCADTQEEVMPLDGTFVMAGERNRLFCFEYLPKGNIRQYLEQEKSHGDDWPTRYQMIRGICQGLQYLHDKHINHLDLKPENVMLDTHMEAKITDFGLSRFLDQGKSRIITQHICGTLRYIAPEVIDKGELSFKSDIYALGIIIIELLTGTSMISLANWDESLYLLDCPLARMCTEIARKCTDAERDNRPTIHEVIHLMDELESIIPKSSTTNKLVTATAFPGTKLLHVYPLELRFLFKPDENSMSCRLTITNRTDCCIFCMVTLKNRDYEGGFAEMMPPLSSSVATVDIEAEEEIPSDMVEWEILVLTTTVGKYHEEYNVEDISQMFSLEDDETFEDVIEALQELFGGELHRAALTASVIVQSEDLLGVHTPTVIVKEEETIESMDVHPTEPWVLLITHDMVYIWNWQTNEKVREYNNPAPLRDVDWVAKFIAQEQWVVIGNTDGSITVHMCPTMDQVREFTAHDDVVSHLEVHRTRPFLLSFSCSRSSSPFLKLWDWSHDWSCTRKFVLDASLWQVMFNPKHTTTFATRGEDGLVQMWNIDCPNPIATTHIQDDDPDYNPFTYTGHRDLAAVIDDDNIRIWDLRKEKHVHTLHNYDGILTVCHPTRPIFITVSYCGRIQVWDSTTYRLMKAFDNFEASPLHVGFTGSTRLVIGYRNGISVLDIELE